MGYYKGDYTGYYGRMRGDPGFFSSVLGIGRSLLGLTPAGSVSRVISAGGAAATAGTIIKRAGGALSRHPVLTAAGAAGVGLAVGGEAGRMVGPAGGCPKGFHPCKARHGCKRGGCVRNRRMRVTNPRALRRAIHRATGFARLARKVLRFTSPRAPKGHAYFKPRKRKK